ncbi:RDD family protein [bacterium BMS3Bbin05]|nr:RDD family protein [bacterium BMS3Bbin05]HDO22609.1 hypothetical protein [Nitrospirota bacterium]HDZ88902.1 hypothetical protein [Nitrospirota bacterium]
MPEELRKADVFLRAVSKTLDFLLIAAVWELLPRAGFFAGIFYILISDGLFDGRSLAKQILGLQVISLKSKRACSIRDSILRNMPFAVGLAALKVPLVGWILFICICLLELILMIGSADSLRIGDLIANTSVVARDRDSGEKQPEELASMEGHS